MSNLVNDLVNVSNTNGISPYVRLSFSDIEYRTKDNFLNRSYEFIGQFDSLRLLQMRFSIDDVSNANDNIQTIALLYNETNKIQQTNQAMNLSCKQMIKTLKTILLSNESNNDTIDMKELKHLLTNVSSNTLTEEDFEMFCKFIKEDLIQDNPCDLNRLVNILQMK